MKQQPEMGMNRTGVQMSPRDSADMTEGVQSLMQGRDDIPDLSAITDIRTEYIMAGDALGSVPLPGSVKGAVSAAASMVTGHKPQLFLDKLGERLAFERTGTRLYDGLISKVQALQAGGTASMPLDGLLDGLLRIRNDEAAHFMLLTDAMTTLGADPTAQTPCADLAGVESSGLMKAVLDPRTTVAQSLHAILVAEMADNNGWEMLIAMAEDQNHTAMAADFTTALQNERQHLAQVQVWFEEATLGAPMARDSAGAPSLH